MRLRPLALALLVATAAPSVWSAMPPAAAAGFWPGERVAVPNKGTVGRCVPGPTRAARAETAANCLLAGQGMWIYMFDATEGGDPERIVARARRAGLSYVLIRAGSSHMGFYAQRDLDRLLPVAHRHGLRVLVWDFPYLDAPIKDAKRGAAELAYTTPGGLRADGLVADIEEPAQGVHLTRWRAARYGKLLRDRVGLLRLLVATTPRPTPSRVANYPYAQIAPSFDAFAPMVYWNDEDPAVAVRLAIERLKPYGLPVAPVGQAYDMSSEGGVKGNPSRWATLRFMRHASAYGAPGVSFWSWQEAKPRNWDAIRTYSRD